LPLKSKLKKLEEDIDIAISHCYICYASR